jgi:exosortase/archaeosortase family protein
MFVKIKSYLANRKLRPVTDALLAATITYGFHLLYRHFSVEINSVPVVKAATIWLTELVYTQSLWINRNLLGLSITTAENHAMIFSNGNLIWINGSCSGLKLIFQVTILFLLFPGPWKHKLWFIPLGWLLMHLSNLFRIVALSIMTLWKHEYWDFTHDWVLRPFFYLVIFAMWVWWVEKFRNGKREAVVRNE